MPEIVLLGMRELRIAHGVIEDTFRDDQEPMPAWEEGDTSLLETLCACTEVYDKYPDLPSKASKLFYSAIKLHCFPNGNKRFGVGVLLCFVIFNDHALDLEPGGLAPIARFVAESDPHGPEWPPDRTVATLTETFRPRLTPEVRAAP